MVWLKSQIKIKIKSLLKKNGFVRIKNIAPIDLREITDSPIKAKEITNSAPALLNIPIERCRTMKPLAFSCTNDTLNPYILSANDYLKGIHKNYENSILNIYYESVQAKNLSDLYNVEVDNSLSKKLSALAFKFPWDGVPSLHYKKKREKDIIMENKSRGFNCSGNEGWHLVGPVSYRKGEFEYSRLTKVLLSIKDNGYNRNNDLDGDIQGTILLKGNDYVVSIAPGQHRIAALSALGFKYIPVRLFSKSNCVINRKDVEMWAGVKSGYYTKESALRLFDRVFDGEQPNIADDYILAIKKLNR